MTPDIDDFKGGWKSLIFYEGQFLCFLGTGPRRTKTESREIARLASYLAMDYGDGTDSGIAVDVVSSSPHIFGKNC